MKIIQLKAENVKKLTVVEITPDGNMVQITGRNGAGKTSVLDAIWWALAGTANVQKQPIRKGADSARIELSLGTGKTVALTVERRFTESASYLTVKTADGAKYPSPQKLLDDLLGSLTFDPLAFMRQDARGQFDVLRKLVKLDVEPAAIDLLNKLDFDARTQVNRDGKALRAQADAITVAQGLPEAPLDEGALLDAIQTAASANTALEQRKARRAEHAAKIVSAREDAARFLAQIAPATDQATRTFERECAELQRQIDALIERQEKLKTKIISDIANLRAARESEAVNASKRAEAMQAELDSAPPLPEPTDLGDLRARLDAAKFTNRQIAQREARSTLETRAASCEALAKSHTRAIEARNASKAAAMAKAEMPISGLAFGDGVVIFRDLPLDQASDAEQLMVSTAIAAALNPKLRVLRIRDGSLLDDDAMARLAAFAEERDMQIWIEVVQSDSPTAIWLEDGHVKGHEPKAEAA